jgi:hypothetical protein
MNFEKYLTEAKGNAITRGLKAVTEKIIEQQLNPRIATPSEKVSIDAIRKFLTFLKSQGFK